MSENDKAMKGTDMARKEKTEDLLRIAEAARSQSSTHPDKFREAFPELGYNYNQASSVLKERGYSVHWSSDAISEENRVLRESMDALEKENESLKGMLKQIQTESEQTRIINLKKSDLQEEQTVYISLPVKESTAKKWRQMFGMLNVKVILGTTAMNDFMQAVIEKKIKIKM